MVLILSLWPGETIMPVEVPVEMPVSSAGQIEGVTPADMS